LEFDELRGDVVGAQRDESLPIVVTIHYTKMTNGGIVTDQSLAVIEDLLLIDKVRPRPSNLALNWTNQVHFLPIIPLPKTSLTYPHTIPSGAQRGVISNANTSSNPDINANSLEPTLLNGIVSPTDIIDFTANTTATEISTITQPSTLADSKTSKRQTSQLPITLSFERSNVLIKRVLKALEMREYIKVFIAHDVFDADLLFLRSRDIDNLVDKIGPKARFSAWVHEYQLLNQDKIEALKNTLHNM
ncbi:hypothetical protein RFI_14950, partial [Reticulomyxa filosa]